MKILLVCGSPRKGNSESITKRLSSIFSERGIENEVVLLREQDVKTCEGCVEYCNRHYRCKHGDAMEKILPMILSADGLAFISPNYFGMPPGIFKNFIDKCSVLWTEKYHTGKPDLSSKKAIVIAVGTDRPFIDEMLHNIIDNFLATLGIGTVSSAGLISRSELKGNYNDIFENTPKVEETLQKMAKKLVKALE